MARLAYDHRAAGAVVLVGAALEVLYVPEEWRHVVPTPTPGVGHPPAAEVERVTLPTPKASSGAFASRHRGALRPAGLRCGCSKSGDGVLGPYVTYNLRSGSYFAGFSVRVALLFMRFLSFRGWGEVRGVLRDQGGSGAPAKRSAGPTADLPPFWGA